MSLPKRRRGTNDLDFYINYEFASINISIITWYIQDKNAKKSCHERHQLLKIVSKIQFAIHVIYCNTKKFNAMLLRISTYFWYKAWQEQLYCKFSKFYNFCFFWESNSLLLYKLATFTICKFYYIQASKFYNIFRTCKLAVLRCSRKQPLLLKIYKFARCAR